MPGPGARRKRGAFQDVTNAKRAKSRTSNDGGKQKRGRATTSTSSRATTTQKTEVTVVSRRSRSTRNSRNQQHHQQQKAPPPPVVCPRPSNAIQNSSYQYSGQTTDLNELDKNDPLAVAIYVEDMFSYYRERESTTSVRPGYMERQPHITESMRCEMVDWIVREHTRFRIVSDGLYLAIHIMDRYLDRKVLQRRQQFPLLGLTALFIASKYEDVYPPELMDLVYYCRAEEDYTKQDVLDMEENILKTLDYRITVPTARTFLCRYLKAAHANTKILQLSFYILEDTLQSYRLLNYLPSQLAAAAVLIARYTAGRYAWSPTLLKYTGYCQEEVLPVARSILKEKKRVDEEEFVMHIHRKYSSERYGDAAHTRLRCEGDD